MDSKKDIDSQHFHYLNVEGTRYRTKLTNKYNHRKPWVPVDKNLITSPIPGSVVKIMVKVGQKVTEGKCLYVLEAMKMKNRIKSLKAGVVTKIHTEEGQIIPRGHLVMELSDVEPKAKASRPLISKTRTK